MRTVLCGFLTTRARVRAVESLTECGFEQRIPDSTLYDVVGKFSGAQAASWTHFLF